MSTQNKSSNTGIDWWSHYDFDGPLARILGLIDGEDFADICEYAAQIAIAEYRKDLAEKVEAIIEAEVPDCTAATHAAPWGVAMSRVLSLLNENDDDE